MTSKKPQGPIFTDDEYEDFDQRPDLNAAWDRLPVVRRIAGFKVRYLGPLVDLGLDPWLGEMSGGAYGYLEDSGWMDALPEAPMLDAAGRVRTSWSRSFKVAVDRLAEAGTNAGPESDPDRWASWLCFELAEPNEVIGAQAKLRGWDR